MLLARVRPRTQEPIRLLREAANHKHQISARVLAYAGGSLG